MMVGFNRSTSKEESSEQPGPIEEIELVNRARKGDKQAFRVLVERYQNKVFGLVLSVVRTKQDAEDITQEAMVKAYFSLSSFHGRSSFYTWLYRIAYNMAIDFKRKVTRRGEDNPEYFEEQVNRSTLGVVELPESPHEVVERKEIMGEIQTALAALSDEHRAVIVLREVDGMSYEEIADVIGISRGTVMSRLHYARKKLQRMLEDAGFAPASNAERLLEEESDQ